MGGSTERSNLLDYIRSVEGASTTRRCPFLRGLMQVTSSWQEGLLVRLCVGDLIDHNAHTALGDDVGGAVAELNADNRMRSIDAKHGEQVHNRICAPADNRQHLRISDLSSDNWISLTVCSLCETVEKLIDNVQEEDHGQEPAHPTRGQVTGDNKLAVIARRDHQGRTDSKVPSLAAEGCIVEFHHEEDLNQEQGHCQEPIHVTVGIVEGNTGQGWGLHLQGTTFNLS